MDSGAAGRQLLSEEESREAAVGLLEGMLDALLFSDMSAHVSWKYMLCGFLQPNVSEREVESVS